MRRELQLGKFLENFFSVACGVKLHTAWIQFRPSHRYSELLVLAVPRPFWKCESAQFDLSIWTLRRKITIAIAHFLLSILCPNLDWNNLLEVFHSIYNLKHLLIHTALLKFSNANPTRFEFSLQSVDSHIIDVHRSKDRSFFGLEKYSNQ